MKDIGGVTVSCCGCKGKVTFVLPERDEDRPTFFHTMPYCKRFDDTNSQEQLIRYLKDCGAALGAS